jgi:energy-coupling factor transporter ATP-binding protein EcfA2
MIHTLVVENFKSLVRVELELGRVNLFIGANGSGKSNLLESLGILGAAAFGRVDDESLMRRGVRPGVPRLYKSAFPTKTKAPHIFFGATSAQGACYEVSLLNPLENPEPAWRFKTERLERSDGDIVDTRGVRSSEHRNTSQGIAALTSVILPREDPAGKLLDELRDYCIYCPNTPTLRGQSPDQQSRKPIGLSGGSLPESVRELLELAADQRDLSELFQGATELVDWSSDFSVGPAVGVPLSPSAARSSIVLKFHDRYMAKGRNTLTAYDASEGALYVLFCAVIALHPKTPRCLAVDNLDQALNPRLASRLMSLLCEWSKAMSGHNDARQWLFTSHNPAVLDGLPLEDPSVRLFAVDRDSRGHTVVRRIDLADALAARPTEEWTLSRMWMNGYLGGVPNV